jgi:hypothetical protein
MSKTIGQLTAATTLDNTTSFEAEITSEPDSVKVTVIQLRDFIIKASATAPSSPSTGDLWLDIS